MAQINGTNGDDTLAGTSGDDTFRPMLGRDTADGLSGHDTVVIDYAASGTGLRDMTVKADGTGGFTGDLENGFNMSRLEFSSIESLVINGGDANTLVEAIDSPALADVSIALTNAPGSTLRIYPAANGSFVLGSDDIARTATGVYSGFGRYEVIANAGTNHIVTGAGADTVGLAGGASTVATGGGDDAIYSTGGADTIDGGPGADSWTGIYGATTTPLAFTYDGESAALSNGLRLSNIETVQLTLGSSADTVTASRGAYYGGGGIDTLNVDRSASTAVYITQATFNVDAEGLAGLIRTDVFGGGVSFQQFEKLHFIDDNYDNGVGVNIYTDLSGLLLNLDAVAAAMTLH